MTRTTVFLLTLIVVGCSPSGPPPIRPASEIPKTESATVAPPVAADRPTESDPAAQLLVTAALDAHTGNDRAAVRKLRVVDYTRTGTGQSLQEDPIGLIVNVNCAWPARMRVRAEFPGPKVSTIVIDGDAGWQRLDAGPVMPLDAPSAAGLQIDTSGEWIWLLFPLLDPDAVFAPAPPLPADPKLHGVKFFHPKLAPSLVYFHPETKLLTRIVYEGRESGQPGVKEFQVIEQDKFAGITLPKRLAQVFRGRQYADWLMTKLEPRASADASLFRTP